MKTIFVTYNPASVIAQTLAIRLHTIGASSGFRMYLPDRSNSNTILDDETKSRISKSDYVIMFSTEKLSEIVKEEINYASKCLHDKSKIIVIYDKKKGKNINGESSNLFTPIYIDDKEQSATLQEIMHIIKHRENQDKINSLQVQKKQLEVEKANANAIAALLGVGLGLFLLSAATSKD